MLLGVLIHNDVAMVELAVVMGAVIVSDLVFLVDWAQYKVSIHKYLSWLCASAR